MVGDQDAVDPVLDRQLRVFRGDDALEHDLHAGDVAHSLDGVPGQIRGLAAAGNAGKIDAIIIVPANHAACETAAVMARRTFAGVAAHQPEQGFLVAARDTVDRYRQDRTAGGSGLLDQRLRDFPLGRGIELEPDRRPARLGDVFHGEVRGRRQYLQMIAGARGPGDGQFAVGMKELVAAGRAHEDRRVVFGAEQLDAGVDLGHVVETVRHELEFQEPLAVGAQRDLVVQSGSHVAEMRGRHVLAGHRLEVEYVDRAFGVIDQIAARRRPDHRIGKL
jgi:hypothetical protein